MDQSSAAMFSAPRSKASKRDQSAPRQLSPLVIAISLLAGGSGGFLISRVLQHVESLQERIATLEDALERTTTEAAIATEHAREATQLAEAADSFREQAESELTQIQTQALRADQRAALAVERAEAAEATTLQAEAVAQQARDDAEKTQREAEAEMNRLTSALGQIAETRRTALGLVMNLNESSLAFDFDDAALRPESREVLSRIAGILSTSDDYQITVTGHTDSVGRMSYNQELSERRAHSVAGYLIETGLPAQRFTVLGLGHSQPLDTGGNDEAHAKNRRVELGIVHARILDPGERDR